MSDPPLVLVTGATGAVGPRVVAALVEAGWRVRTLSLDGPPQGALPGAVRDVRIGDINDKAAVASAMEGVDAVVHLAALLHIVNPPAALQNLYRRVNVDGTRTVVDTAVAAGVRRVLFFSTIAVYGPTGGRGVDEITPPQPDTFYARTKLEAEGIVLQAINAAGEPLGTVLRLAAVYGTRIKGNYDQLLRALHRGWFLPLGRGQNRRTLVYDRDVAQAAVLALGCPEAAGRIYNVTDGCWYDLNEIIATLCGALGRKPPRWSLPLALVRVLAGFADMTAGRLGVSLPLNRARIDKYVEDVAVEGNRIQRELGFTPRFDLARGWADAVREMGLVGKNP